MAIKLTTNDLMSEARGRLGEAVWLIQRALVELGGADADVDMILELLDDAVAHVSGAQGTIELVRAGDERAAGPQMFWSDGEPTGAWEDAQWERHCDYEAWKRDGWQPREAW